MSENFASLSLDRRHFLKSALAAAVAPCFFDYSCVALDVCHSSSAIDPVLVRFLAAKRAQTKTLATQFKLKLPEDVWRLYDVLEQGRWEEAGPLLKSLRSQIRGNGEKDSVPAQLFSAWTPLFESYATFDQFNAWDQEFFHHFGRAIMDAIEANSIYLGGTDPGRFFIAALSQSQIEGSSFYTITQNALADHAYLEYLRAMYGHILRLPSPEDSDRVYQEYLTDALDRHQLGQLKPGEQVEVMDDHKVNVSGQVAVMTLNGMLAKIIFDRNPDRSFYVEESFPLEWMYPHLVPHGPILKLHRQPLAQLSESMLRQDHEYWSRLTGRFIGNWLTDDTPIHDICGFVERVHWHHDLDRFEGHPKFLSCQAAQRAFSKLRSAIGGLFIWRLQQTDDLAPQSSLARAADLAFRQAYALCPSSPEALFRYVNFLTSMKRLQEAMLLCKTSLHLDPDNIGIQSLISQLESPSANRQGATR